MRPLRAPLAVLMLSTLVSACGPVGLTVTETSQQAMANAAQAMAGLKSVKYDFTASIVVKLPQTAQVQSLGLAGTLAVDLGGTGEAVFPDRSHTTAAVRMGSISATTETIVIGRTVYLKSPITGRWISASTTGSASPSSLGAGDPLSYAQLLDTAESITDLGDTTLDGVAVHHYRVALDKARLIQRIQSLPAYANPQAQQLFRQIIDHGTLTLEVWFGKADHLVRRISADASVSLDAGGLRAALGGAAVPSGSDFQITEHTVINYHDFNSQVTVTAPSLS